MKRKKTSSKKYALGTGASGVSIKNYIETPGETMTRNDIAKAKADYEAMTDPLASGIEIGTTLLAQSIQSGSFNKTKGVQTAGLDNQITPAGTVMSANPQISNSMKLPVSFGAYGAKVKGNIEIEGDEVVQTPTGQVTKMQGPSHEEGGIDMNIVPSNEELTQTQIPENSQVIPDRILGADGRTLADRAMTRERKERNIDKILSINKTDMAVKNAANRKKSFLKKEATEDMLLQTMVQQMMQPQEEPQQMAPWGDGKVQGTAPYPYKSLINNFGEEPIPGYNSFINKFGQVDPVNQITPVKGVLDSKGLPDHFAPSSSTPSLSSIQTVGENEESTTFDPGYLPKIGDLFGLYGNYKSGRDALANTAEERAGDTANVNMYRDFGKRSLEKFSQSEEYLGLLKDEALKRSAANAAGLKKSGRNLRGIQQVQGAEFVANQNQNQAESDIYAQNAAQMMQLMGQEAQFMGHQDQVVMGGEQARDLADRQDRSAYFTNKAQDLQTRATGLQQTGKDLNQIAMNPQMMKLLKDFGKYFSVDNSGKLIAKATV
jgi:hypothetical protein